MVCYSVYEDAPDARVTVNLPSRPHPRFPTCPPNRLRPLQHRMLSPCLSSPSRCPRPSHRHPPRPSSASTTHAPHANAPPSPTVAASSVVHATTRLAGAPCLRNSTAIAKPAARAFRTRRSYVAQSLDAAPVSPPPLIVTESPCPGPARCLRRVSQWPATADVLRALGWRGRHSCAVASACAAKVPSGA